MKTTLNIDDALMRRVKQRARETGRSITEIVEQALRRDVSGVRPATGGFTLRWTPVSGRLQPGVDLSDRDSLYDLMERAE
jgi:hypothetical protein